ncbi:unnamed protein product [Cylicocyclus nassatus]|uniref:Uncharacterized protein n=1 Tax=Cylicocyclus nassatus TaxID=53992 RepID=A0AA36M860_CYLNA|nr:unnamed protein product [Cylicocyclus nassatus]
MIRTSRIQWIAIIVMVTISFILIHNAYTVHKNSGKPLIKGNIEAVKIASMPRPASISSFKEPEFPFEVIVTGQDADRDVRKNGGKSFGAAAFSLEGQTCRIPKLDINGSEVKNFFFNSKPLECSKNPQNWLFIDGSNNVQYIESRKSAKCSGSYVTRKNDSMSIHTAFDSLPAGNPMKSDFAVVRCKDGEQTWDGILMSVVRRSDQELLNHDSMKSPDGSGLNVYFLGFDSLSQMSFRRKLPKSVKVLEEVFDAVVLNGYNIVGDGTPQAFIPILTASTEEELPLTRKRFQNANYVDDVYPFIWSNFSSAGYVTLYGEDVFVVGAFNYRLKGFRNQPTDHYLRTIFKDYEKKGGHCLGSEPLHKTWFRYSREFMQVYKDMPRFLLMHQCRLSHDDINLVEVEDEDLASTLLEMHKSGALDDALVIVMADHGHRFAKLRETHQGQLEERLPFFAISLPAKFRQTEIGKKMAENLRGNKNRLTTPFDIHATLMDILHLPKDLSAMQDTSKRSLSLFRPIPENRTCSQAGIEAHWCTCLKWEDAMNTPEDKEMSQKLALAIVSVINRQLKDVFHLCAKLSLKELLEAKKLVPNEGLLKYKNVKDKDGFVPDLSGKTKTAFAHYQIKLRTKPGNAVYEVTLFYDFVAKEVHIDLNSISHPSKFGDAPHCIINDNYFLATFCVCHDKVTSFDS